MTLAIQSFKFSPTVGGNIFIMSKYKIGIDLGGTKIEGVILDDAGRELIRKRIPTERELGYQHILNRLKWLHDELAATVPGEPTTFGIGTPGAISPRTGR